MTIENDPNLQMSSIGLSIQSLKRKLIYDPATGIFTRKIDSNNRMAGTVAGSLREDGYIYIYIDGYRVLGHVLAWLYFYEARPTHKIDHKNEIKHDNRIINLRPATYAQNNINQGPQINNILGVKGVKRHGNKFVARITYNKTTHYLGLFNSIEDAVNARREAEEQFYGRYAWKEKT